MSPWPRWCSTALAALPLEALHAEEGTLQRFGGGQVVLLGPGEDDLDRVDQQYQFTARAQYPGRFGNPRIRVAPDAGANSRDHQVEGGVGERGFRPAWPESEGNAA